MLPNLKLSSFAILLMVLLPLAILASEPASASSDPVEAAPGQAVGGELTLSASGPAPEISIQAPGSISDWTLDPQQTVNIKEQTITVNATGPWQISVYPDSITLGYLTEYDSANSQFVQGGARLSSPLTFTAKNGNTVDLSAGGVLVQGQGDEVVPITLEQKVTWNDPALPDGHTYQIGLTFSGSPL